MQYDEKMKRMKLIVIGLVVLVFGIVAVNVVLGVQRSAKIAVTIEVMPKDAAVTIDSKRSRAGTAYVSPGSHTFTASKEGFTDAKQTVVISDTTHYVGLILPAVSAEAKKWAASDVVWPELERIAGEISSTQSAGIRQKTPLINYLPESDILGPYTISYAISGEGTDEKATIVVKNSTANGRIKALQWIRKQGFDPADLTIQFEDFNNPTNQGDI